MLIRRLSQAGTTAALTAAAVALAACGREPYPTPSEEPPPPPPVAELYGEAVPPPPEPPPPPPPEAVAPVPLEALPPPTVDLAGPPPAEPPAPVEASPPSAPVVIAMAPIPNPPEAVSAPAAPARTVAPARRAEAPARPRLRAVPPVARVAPPPAVVQRGPVQPPALEPPAAPSALANAGSPLGDRSTRLAALETALTEWVAREAVLDTPARFTTGQPALATLTLPAGLATALRAEAARNDLADAAASANVTATLSGEGFTIVPNAIQARPLVADQPTQFTWTVTPQDGRRGALGAEVGADLVGAGSDMLSLGSVRAGGGFVLPGIGEVSPRWIGIAILVLIAALIFGLLSRGRRPARPARPSRDTHRERPVSLTE